VERAVRWNGALVRTIGGRERVVDVRDRHHPRLHRDVLGLHLVRVSPAIQLLVMAIRNARDVLELARPRNLLEEAVSVRYVRLDLTALAVVEVAFANDEELQLVILEQRALAAFEIREGASIDLLERLEASLGEYRWLVRSHDCVEKAQQL